MSAIQSSLLCVTKQNITPLPSTAPSRRCSRSKYRSQEAPRASLFNIALLVPYVPSCTQILKQNPNKQSMYKRSVSALLSSPPFHSSFPPCSPLPSSPPTSPSPPSSASVSQLRSRRFRRAIRSLSVKESSGDADDAQLHQVVLGSSANEVDTRPPPKKKQKVCARKRKKTAAQPPVPELQSHSAFASLGHELGRYGLREKLFSVSR